MNPILRQTSKLMMALRKADPESLNEAREALQAFADSWLVDGNGTDMAGAGSCSMADTDLAIAIIPVIEIWEDKNS